MSANMDRYLENRIYLSCSDFVIDEKKLYFSNRTFNALVIVDRETLFVEHMEPFIGEKLEAGNLHLRCHRQGKLIYFLPQGNHRLHIYDTESGEQRICEPDLDEQTRQSLPWWVQTWGLQIWEGKMYLLPGSGSMGLWSMHEAGRLCREKWWSAPSDYHQLMHGDMDERHFFTWEFDSEYFAITDLGKSAITEYRFPDERVFDVTYDGQDFWYIAYDSTDIVRWNPSLGEADRFHFEKWDKCGIGGQPYAGIHAEGQKIFVVSGRYEEIFVLDKENRSLQQVYEMPESYHAYKQVEKKPAFLHFENQLIWTSWGIGWAAVIDLETLKGKTFKNVIPTDERVQEYFDQVLFQNAPLLMEDAATWSLEKFLYHCENSIL